MSSQFYPEENEGDFFPIADLMSALMAVFMCATIIIIMHLDDAGRSSTQVQQSVMQAFHRTIRDDLKQWDAEFFPEQGYVKFNAVFGSGVQTPSSRFRQELDDYCPKLRRLLEKHPKLFREIRVEGHTSDQWQGEGDPFIGNMAVAQGRALYTMEYCLQASGMADMPALRDKFTSVGMSFKKPITTNGLINWQRSKRVEFWFVFHDSQTLLEVQL
ncbi:MAG: hypothetical protein KTR20_13850 [Cellvibrionaceae bacterium]|nr:hypothetical protein [Cellvibrionaceae bacterium]